MNALRTEILMALIAAVLLGVWAWFWTGPELRLESAVYEQIARDTQ